MTRTRAQELTTQRLQGVHPNLVEKLWRIWAALDALNHPIFVVQGVRTTEEQQALYAQGRTKPGRIVTNADGVIKKSNHQVKADGFGHAVDCAFITDDPFDAKNPWSLYGGMAELIGLYWGGRWQSIKDLPHVELPHA